MKREERDEWRDGRGGVGRGGGSVNVGTMQGLILTC